MPVITSWPYKWTAVLKDFSRIEQYSGNTTYETPFQKVIDRFDDLMSFSIYCRGFTYTVSMIDGKFTVTTPSNSLSNDITLNFYLNEQNGSHYTNFRPIYFVRESINIDLNRKEGITTPNINFIGLGFQANVGQQNIKRIIKIYQDGRPFEVMECQ